MMNFRQMQVNSEQRKYRKKSLISELEWSVHSYDRAKSSEERRLPRDETFVTYFHVMSHIIKNIDFACYILVYCCFQLLTCNYLHAAAYLKLFSQSSLPKILNICDPTPSFLRRVSGILLQQQNRAAFKVAILNFRRVKNS